MDYLTRTLPARHEVVGWAATSEPGCGNLGLGECVSQRLGEMTLAADELALAVVNAHLLSRMLGVVLIWSAVR
jgi:hypothetical protein